MVFALSHEKAKGIFDEKYKKITQLIT